MIRNVLFYILLIAFCSAYAQKSNPFTSLSEISQESSNSEILKQIDDYIWEKVLFVKPDSALILASKQLQYARQIENRTYEARALNNQGIAYALQSEYESALKKYDSALIIYQDLKDSLGIAKAQNSIGISKMEQGDLIGATDMFTKSLTIRELLDHKKGQSDALNNLGRVHQKLNQPEEAIPYYTKSLLIIRDSDYKRNEALVLTNLGTCYYQLLEYDSALSYFKQSLAVESDFNDDFTLSRTYMSMANVYFNLKEYDSSEVYANKSLAINQEVNNVKGIAEVYSKLGSIHYAKGNNSKAISFAQEALDMAQAITNPTVIKESSELLYRIYNKQGDYLSALRMHELFKKTGDLISGENMQKEILTQELTYKFEKQKAIADVEAKQKIEIAEKEKEKSNLKFITLLFGTIFILVFLIILYQRFRLISSQKKTIEQQYKQISDDAMKIVAIEKEKHEQDLRLKRKDMEAVVANNKLQIQLKENLKEDLQSAYKSNNIKQELKNIIFNLKSQIETQEKLSLIETNLQEVNTQFFEKLQQKHPEVSKTEKEICVYLKLGLSTKEIASLRNTSVNTINVTKTRLRNKLGLNSNSEINSYLLQF